MKAIMDWMLENKIAANEIQMSNIIVGLRLYELKTDEEKKARVILYRKWRPKTDRKNQVPTWQAFQLAIAGISPDDYPVRQVEMVLQ